MRPRTSRRWCKWWRRASTAARPVWRSSRWVEPPPPLPPPLLPLVAPRLAALLADALIRLVHEPLTSCKQQYRRCRRPAVSLSCSQASLLHAAHVAGKEDGPEGEAAVADLLAQATEAAVHGALSYKSAQLLVGAQVGCQFSFRAESGPSWCCLGRSNWDTRHLWHAR